MPTLTRRRAVGRSLLAFAATALLSACLGTGAEPASDGPIASPGGPGSPAVPGRTVVPSSSSPEPDPTETAGPSAGASSDPTGAPTGAPWQALADLPAVEGALNAIVVSGDTVVVAGMDGAFRPTIAVFDGTSWTAATVPDADGQVAGIAGLGGRLIAVGHHIGIDTWSAFIWESRDGRTWREVTVLADAALYDVAAANGTLVAVGDRHNLATRTPTATVWHSTNGTTWRRATSVADSARSGVRTVTALGAGFAAVGSRSPTSTRGRVAVWRASSPASWAAAEGNLDPDLVLTSVAPAPSGFAVGGGTGIPGDQRPVIALSADGRRWRATELSTADGYVGTLSLQGDTLLGAGIDADRLTLWSLRAGTWSAEVVEQSGATINELAWDPRAGLIGVGSRGGRQALWLLGEP